MGSHSARIVQEAAIAHESRKLAGVATAVAELVLASPREPPDKMSPRQDALENAEECPSDLDTRDLEREAMPRRVSKYGIVAVTSRFATPWNTRAQWSCFYFICGLIRTASASDEVMVSGYWSKRGNGTTTGVVEVADSIPSFAVNVGAGGAVAKAMLVWRVAMSSCSVWSRQMRPSAEIAVEHPKAGNREECASGRLACAQCAQMGEAESVSQQEFSISTRLAERAQMMLHAAMKTE